MADSARYGFLVEVARLHHDYGLTQETIARQFRVSRSTISRALNEAEVLGIIQISIAAPMPREAELAQAIRDRYGISAQVGMRLAGESGREAAARTAARLVERLAAAGHVTIAASWGRTLARTAQLVRPRRTTDVVVVDAVGHAGGGEMPPAIEVTQKLAEALSAAAVHLPSPAFVDSPASRQSLLASPPVHSVLEAARNADVTLVSVGIVGKGSLLWREGLLSDAMEAEITRRGAVGEVLGRHYDASGEGVEGLAVPPVGLSLDELRGGRRVLAVAAGPEKAAAVRGALAGGILREIVVDEGLALALLAGQLVSGSD